MPDGQKVVSIIFYSIGISLAKLFDNLRLSDYTSAAVPLATVPLCFSV